MASQNKVKAGGIMKHEHLCLVGVMSAPDQPGIVARIFGALGSEHLNAHFIVQSIDLNNDSHVQFCISSEDCARVMELLAPIAQELGAQKVITNRPVALVSVFGPDFRERPGIAGLAFGALGRAGVNIIAISTSISTVSCVIDNSEIERAVEALGGVFDLP